MSAAVKMDGSRPGRRKQLRGGRGEIAVASRQATSLFARERRWKRSRKNNRHRVALLLVFCVAAPLIATLLAGKWLEAARPASVSESGPGTEIAALAADLFPDAIGGAPRVSRGVAVAGEMRVSLFVPAHLLESPQASADPFDRLAAPFIGAERSLSGQEIDRRIGKLAEKLAAQGKGGCYTYRLGAAHSLLTDGGKRLRVRTLEIDLGTVC